MLKYLDLEGRKRRDITRVYMNCPISENNLIELCSLFQFDEIPEVLMAESIYKDTFSNRRDYILKGDFEVDIYYDTVYKSYCIIFTQDLDERRPSEEYIFVYDKGGILTCLDKKIFN